MKGLKARLWPSKGLSTAQSGGRIQLAGGDPRGAVTVAAESSPSVHDYTVQVSAPNSRERTWSPLGATAKHGNDGVELQALDRIRVDREIDVSQP